MLQGLVDKHNIEVSEDDRKTWAKWEEEAIIAAVKKEDKPRRDIDEVIKTLSESPNRRIAIVSSGEDSVTAAHIDASGYLGCINMPIMQLRLARDFEEVGAKATPGQL